MSVINAEKRHESVIYIIKTICSCQACDKKKQFLKILFWDKKMD